MKGKYLISAVLLTLTTFKFSAMIIPNHQSKNHILMNHITQRNLTDKKPITKQNLDTQLVTNKETNARELHTKKHKSVPYKGFHKVRPLSSNK